MGQEVGQGGHFPLVEFVASSRIQDRVAPGQSHSFVNDESIASTPREVFGKMTEILGQIKCEIKTFLYHCLPWV